MNKIINLNSTVSEVQAEAVKLHQSIMLNAELAANSMVNMCKDLKEMRDRKLYEELGCSDFGSYTEQLVGIKARQAYTYISTYEKLGESVLQSNATLGITKLSLIAQMNLEQRQEMLENGEAEDMSVSEMKRIVEENKNQGEQISMLTEEIEKLKTELEQSDNQSEEYDSDKFEDEISELEKELDERKFQIKELTEELEKAKQSASQEIDRKALEKEIKNKLESETSKKIEAEKKKSLEAGKKEASAEAEKKIELLKQQIEANEKHTQKLQKELELSDSSSAEAKVYIASIQSDFNSLMQVISSMPDEQGNKFRGAVIKLCNAIKKSCEE